MSININDLSYDNIDKFGNYNNINTIVTRINSNFSVFDLSANISKSYVDGSLALKSSITYVDSSLGSRDVSILFLKTYETAQDSSITYLKNYFDGSIATRDTSISNLKTYIDGSLSVTLKTIPTGDSSGKAGDTFYDVSTAYLKIGSKWYKWQPTAAF